MFTSGPTHGEAIGQFEGEPLYHGSLDRAEYLALLETHGFRVVEQVTEDPACGGHTVWLSVFVEYPACSEPFLICEKYITQLNDYLVELYGAGANV